MFLKFEYAGIYMMRALKNKVNYILFLYILDLVILCNSNSKISPISNLHL